MRESLKLNVTKAAGIAARRAAIAKEAAGKKADAAMKKANHELHWAGPVILTTLGLIWLLHGYGLLPSPLNVPWLGAVLLVLGLVRLGMYFMGHY
ncbi:hypothetical protein HYV82_03155 [Candidatus Woesearchaeota archaeon]|nr:hypothetical protein [Candidatus Woesearchaeota archaeon]